MIGVFNSSEMKWQCSKRQINRLRGKCYVEKKNSCFRQKLSMDSKAVTGNRYFAGLHSNLMALYFSM